MMLKHIVCMSVQSQSTTRRDNILIDNYETNIRQQKASNISIKFFFIFFCYLLLMDFVIFVSIPNHIIKT